jgi:hypothetical protein
VARDAKILERRQIRQLAVGDSVRIRRQLRFGDGLLSWVAEQFGHRLLEDLLL